MKYKSSKIIFQKFDFYLQSLQYKQKNQDTPLTISQNLLIKNWRPIYKSFITSAKEKGVSGVWSVSCVSESEAPDFVKAWKEESDSNGVVVFDQFGESVRQSELSGVDVRFADGAHLSDIGEKIAGQALNQQLSSHLKSIMPNHD